MRRCVQTFGLYCIWHVKWHIFLQFYWKKENISSFNWLIVSPLKYKFIYLQISDDKILFTKDLKWSFFLNKQSALFTSMFASLRSFSCMHFACALPPYLALQSPVDHWNNVTPLAECLPACLLHFYKPSVTQSSKHRLKCTRGEKI